MTSSTVTKKLIKSTLTAFILFALFTFAFYLLTRQDKYFSLGFPFMFYKQFLMDGSDFHFGWTISNLITDCLIFFLFSFLYVIWSDYKRQPVVRSLVNLFSWIIIAFWCLLTGIVILALVDRWMNPGTKGISNVDLLTYGYISLWLLGLFALFKLTLLIIKRLQTKQGR